MIAVSAVEALDPQPIVRLRSVSKTFSNGTIALTGLDLDVGRGEFLSLLGPSGCGKSTALRIMAGLTQPSAGRIEWPGATDPTARGHGEDLGFVFQEPTLMPWATVFDNVRLPLRLKGRSKASVKDEVMEALDLVGSRGFHRSLPPRTLRRDEDARLDRARDGDPP